MPITTFQGFLATANLHHGLLVDLCAEAGVIGRAKLLAYMERHGVAPMDKEALIQRYRRAAILYEETEDTYTVNPVVAGLVNFYERRGRLTHAEFLKDQIVDIGNLTDALQQALFADPPEPERIADTVDKLYLVVRQVRESGYQHYQACMRAFGDMKRNSEGKRIDQRIEDLKTVNRRYIEPLSELIDPHAEPVRKMARLRRCMADLAARTGLLADSVELSDRRQRLLIDIQYIDYTLIHHFETLIDTSRSLLNSLIEEKTIKEALAKCLGDLDAVWLLLSGETVVVAGTLASQAPGMERLGLFFNDVVHRRYVARPRPLSTSLPQEARAESLLLFEEQLLKRIREAREIEDWPAFVNREFSTYPPAERLKAIALPLVMASPPFRVTPTGRTFHGDLNEFTIEMEDFGIVWEESHAG